MHKLRRFNLTYQFGTSCFGFSSFSVSSDESRNKDIHTCVFWHKLHTAVTNRRGADRRMHAVRGQLSTLPGY